MHPNKLLREARLRISSLVISARSMQTPMTELACTSLLMARGHYGELLGQTSQAVSPYAFEEARREAGVSTEIAPEAERAERAFPLSGDMVADLDAIRRELEDLQELHGVLVESLESAFEDEQVRRFGDWALLRLVEAKFGFGYELGRIRDPRG